MDEVDGMDGEDALKQFNLKSKNLRGRAIRFRKNYGRKSEVLDFEDEDESKWLIAENAIDDVAPAAPAAEIARV